MAEDYAAGIPAGVYEELLGGANPRDIAKRHVVPYGDVCDARRELATELYQSGLSLGQVGQKLGVSSETVGRAFKQMGVETRPGGRRCDYAEAVELYRTGLSLWQVGQKLGVSHETVRRALKQTGVEGRSPRRFDYSEAAELYRSGLSQREVGLRLGVTFGAVQRALETMGVKARPRGWYAINSGRLNPELTSCGSAERQLPAARRQLPKSGRCYSFPLPVSRVTVPELPRGRPLGPKVAVRVEDGAVRVENGNYAVPVDFLLEAREAMDRTMKSHMERSEYHISRLTSSSIYLVRAYMDSFELRRHGSSYLPGQSLMVGSIDSNMNRKGIFLKTADGAAAWIVAEPIVGDHPALLPPTGRRLTVGRDHIEEQLVRDPRGTKRTIYYLRKGDEPMEAVGPPTAVSVGFADDELAGKRLIPLDALQWDILGVRPDKILIEYRLPYAIVRSNKKYLHYNKIFVEFDPTTIDAETRLMIDYGFDGPKREFFRNPDNMVTVANVSRRPLSDFDASDFNRNFCEWNGKNVSEIFFE